MARTDISDEDPGSMSVPANPSSRSEILEQFFLLEVRQRPGRNNELGGRREKGHDVIFKCIDHVAFAVTDLDRSIAWWSRLLVSEPFDRGTWLAADIGDYVGTKVGYTNCDMSAAFWALPGGTVLELIEYHNPPPGRVDMATYNAGNAHFCFETTDIRDDYERMREHAEFRSPDPVESVWGPYKGSLLWYLRDPDGITIELVQFAERGRVYDRYSPLGHPHAMNRPGPAG